MTCQEFYQYIKGEKELLKKVKSSEKYSHTINLMSSKLPHNESNRQKWNEFFIENNIGIGETNKNSLICSAHFDSKYFLQYKKTRQLVRNAVPTIIVYRAKNIYPEITRLSTSSTLCTAASKPEVKVLTNNIYCDRVSTLNEVVLMPDSDITLSNILSESVSASNECSSQRSLNVSINNLLPESLSTFEIQKPSCRKNYFSCYVAASQPEYTDTPKLQFLKRVINKLTNEIQIKNKQLKILKQTISQRGINKLTSEIQIKNKKLEVLKQTISRQNNKIVSLKSIILKLQKENLIDDEASNVLLDSFGSKKALCRKNFKDISNFVAEFKIYIEGLKVKENINDVNYVPIL
ncbi:hypothetical protein QTP88_020554 [Uroleucon formosanum]